MNGWLNLYKPKGISSAKAVAIAKKHFKGDKIGHTGTLDLEAEGVLPLAIGQATKLVSILMDSKKQYQFTIQFGAKTTTADAAGEVIQTTSHFPSKKECADVCAKFIGVIEQTPPAYSALKIDGVRAYKLARQNQKFEIKKRPITIYDLKLLHFDEKNNQASYQADCSKGTYIRTLAEDVSLSLQSLGFVIELRRTKVGIFNEANSVNILDLDSNSSDEFIKSPSCHPREGGDPYLFMDPPIKSEDDSSGSYEFIRNKCLKIEAVLDDIPVLEVDESIAKKVRFGQHVSLSGLTGQSMDPLVKPEDDRVSCWLKYDDKILAIGNLQDGCFKSLRVFNYIENGE